MLVKMEQSVESRENIFRNCEKAFSLSTKFLNLLITPRFGQTTIIHLPCYACRLLFNDVIHFSVYSTEFSQRTEYSRHSCSPSL